jgi:hypothetical protein
LKRSALVEAMEQFTRALDQIASLPATPQLRRAEIELQVALANTLMHTKGYAAPDTKAALDQARLLIERADALKEPHEDTLLPFSILYGFWASNYVAFEGDVLLELARKFLRLAEKQRVTALLMIGHRLMAISLVSTGNTAEGCAHYDQALALYDPAEHRSLASRFGQDVRVVILSQRSLALWALGFPDAALVDAERALENAREIDHAATVMYALNVTTWTHIFCGNYVLANALADELAVLAEERGALYWKPVAMMNQGRAYWA